MIHFVCPITLKCYGDGYPVTLPADWVKTYGPAIRTGLTVFNIACSIGRLWLPIPKVDDVVGDIQTHLSEQST
eukprot:CAMPEP_0197434728 /NCGR_PEP_ID=MMETSP1175-20131217/2424_1 /TAXON_ID=1003142 /ORGANISM="Triceratium dubium, Strain CCMP147" /LENGTH=72 /DNA_ID=CAMNT_0042963559 /DNA_START=1 /DNA_END=215 /DNA_ORIENTATION=-